MGQNFDDYSSFQPKTTPAQRYATQCSYSNGFNMKIKDPIPENLVLCNKVHMKFWRRPQEDTWQAFVGSHHFLCILCNTRNNQKSSPADLVLEFEMWRHFNTKQKSFTFFGCVDCVWLYGLSWSVTLNFRYLKLKKSLSFSWGYIITEDICNKFIKVIFCLGCMVCLWLRLFQHWTFVKYWWDEYE